MKHLWVVAVFFSIFLPVNLKAASVPTYHIIQSIPVPGDGGWDYVTADDKARRLYIAHSTQTQIMDMDQLTVVGSIPDTNGVHGIALAPELHLGFITAGRDNQVVVFDTKEMKSLGTIKVGEGPDAIVYEPMTQTVFAFNGRSQTATLINAVTREVKNMLPLGGRPEFAAADGHGWVYLDLEDKSELLKINSRAMAVERRWPLGPCQEPSSIAVDPRTERIFVGCRNKVMAVVDASSGKVVAHLPIGAYVDATVFDAVNGLIFNSNGVGTITAIHEDSRDRYHVVQTIPTQQGARTMALDQATSRLFLPVAKWGPPPRPEPGSPPLPAGRQGRLTIQPGTFAILVVAPSRPK